MINSVVCRKTKLKYPINLKKMLIWMSAFIPLLCGISTSTANLASFLELGILLFLYNYDEYWVITPVMFIFFPQLILVGESISLFNVYCILCVLKLFREVRKIRFKGNMVILIQYLLILYAACINMLWRSAWEGVVLVLQATSLLCILLSIKQRSHLNNDIQNIFIITCINAAIYGVLYKNIVGNFEVTNEVIQYNVRYSGSSGDPNYMAFYYCIALCYLMYSKRVKPMQVILGTIALFVATALTGSLTALVVILFIIMIRLFAGKDVKLHIRILVTAVVVILLATFIFYLFTDTFEIPLLETYKNRILERLDFLGQENSLSNITSGRADLQEMYLNYFFQQSILRIMFGGYQINSQGIDSAKALGLGSAATHSTYVDILMTCGLIGFAIFIGSMIFNLIRYWKNWRLGDDESLVSLIRTIAAMIFIAGISVFPGTNYMYFLMM